MSILAKVRPVCKKRDKGEVCEVFLREGIAGQDHNVDKIMALWEELQLCTVDAAHPELDVVSFSMNSFYFALIMSRRPPDEEDISADSSTASRTSDTKWPHGQSHPDYVERRSEAPPSAADDPRNLWDSPGASSVPEYPPYPLSCPTELFDDSVHVQPFSDAEYLTNLNDANDAEQDSRPPSSPPPPIPEYDLTYLNFEEWPVGIVYLTETPLTCAHDQVGEVNIGIILDKAYRGNGYAHQVVQCVLTMAFEEKGCHRVQAAILNTLNKDASMTLFTQMKFSHEGVRRLAYFDRFMQEWKDVTYLALLDTDWLNQAYIHPAPKSLWDEMFARHGREREELLRWEDRKMKLKRSSSMETILPSRPFYPAPSIMGNESDYQSASESDTDARLQHVGRPRSPSLAAPADSDVESDLGSSVHPHKRSRSIISGSSDEWGGWSTSGSSGGRGNRSPSPSATGSHNPFSDVGSPFESDSPFMRASSPALSTASVPASSISESEVSSYGSVWESDTSSNWDMMEIRSEASDQVYS